MAQRIDGHWVISPQDIVAEFECDHRVALNAAVSSGALPFQEVPNPGLELLRRRGLEHEQRRLDGLPASWRVVRLDTGEHGLASYRSRWDQTQRAMADEVDVIYQAVLFTGDFVGLVDFLLLARDQAGRILRDAHGRAIYEPVDAKSARSAKRAAVLQVGAYAHALQLLGMPAARQVHLWLAGDADWHGDAAPYAALAGVYARQVAARLDLLGSVPKPDWAAPREACPRCRFAEHCAAGRLRDRDLSMVQGMRASTRQRLVAAGLTTIDELAAAGPAERPSQVARESFDRLRAQAHLQVLGERQARVIREVVDPAVITGLPPRSPGDLWFDMEGDPHIGDHGLEYMLGYGFLQADDFGFDAFIAHDWAGERQAFESFIDLVIARIAEHPGMHVYHYADYERRTLRRLAQQHGTREAELDRILREGRLVDLYGIVRRGLRLSTPSLSLKDVESAYGVAARADAVSTAMDSIIEYERSVALRAAGEVAAADQVLAAIRDYNEQDCRSTMMLDTWLRSLVESGDASATLVESSTAGSPDDESTDADERIDPYQDLAATLLAGVPVDALDRTPGQHGQALLAASLQYHRREARPAWWQLFSLMSAEVDELSEESTVVLVDQAQASEWSIPPRARRLQRRIQLQCQGDPRTLLDPGTGAFALYEIGAPGMHLLAGSTRGYQQVTVASVGEDQGDPSIVEVIERAGPDEATWSALPFALLPGPPYDASPIQRAIGEAAARARGADGSWQFPQAAWADLLLGRGPRLGRTHLASSGDALADVLDSLLDCMDSYVAVQGPPGTGKTFVGAHAVARLAQAGWRVGVVAQSHAVVDHFLHGVRAADASIALGKEPQLGTAPVHPWHLAAGEKVQSWAMAQSHGYVIGGTAWTFSREQVQALRLDLLVIDEAGQFALANAVACALAARNVLLLGDPQQLPQVSQAVHPESIEASVLERVIAGHPTMPADRGIFLPMTYRMHPRLTRPVSLLQYEGRLEADPVTVQRHLDQVAPGLIPVPVAHQGNTTSCEEEADEIVRIARGLIGRAWTGADQDGIKPTRPLDPGDILVVAPYNAQVRLVRNRLDRAGLDRVAVGTVDKFQGRQAVIAIVSMTASSEQDIPRGLEFLLSPNRINVAISRAQWASYLVHSPTLALARPTTVEGLARVGEFIRLIGQAEPGTSPTPAGYRSSGVR